MAVLGGGPCWYQTQLLLRGEISKSNFTSSSCRKSPLMTFIFVGRAAQRLVPDDAWEALCYEAIDAKGTQRLS